MRARTVIAAAILALVAGAASAETVKPGLEIPQGTRLRAYAGLDNDFVASALIRTGNRVDALAGRKCGQPARSLRTLWIIAVNAVVMPDAATHPTAGLWWHRAVVTRCGEDSVHNVLFEARPGDRPKAFPIISGTTIASLKLQADVARVAYMTARIFKPQACPPGVDEWSDVIDTALASPAPGDGATWQETWTMRVCAAETVALRVDFERQPGGGTSFVINRR
jgi:hypothetical protein